jgi:hypothetical protein
MAKPAQSFKDLVVWQKAHALVLDVYTLTRKLPREELFGTAHPGFALLTPTFPLLPSTF